MTTGRDAVTTRWSASTATSLDSQANPLLRMTLLGVFASYSRFQTARDVELSSDAGRQA
jgi:hypothetical protein